MDMSDCKNGYIRSPYKSINIIKKSEETHTDINNTNSSNYIYPKKNITVNDVNREDYFGDTAKDNDSNFSSSQKNAINNKILPENTKINKINLTANFQNLITKNTTGTFMKNTFLKDQSTNTNGHKIFFNEIINEKIHSKKSDKKLIHNSDHVTRTSSNFNINMKNNFRLSKNYRKEKNNDNNHLQKYKNYSTKNKKNKIDINEKIVTSNINSEPKKKNNINKNEKLKKKNNTYSSDFIQTFYSSCFNKGLLNSSFTIINNYNLLFDNKIIHNNLNSKVDEEIPINLNKNVYKIINSVINTNNNKGYSIRELHRQIFLSSHPYRHQKKKKIIKINLNKNKNKNNNKFFASPQKIPKRHLERVGINEFELNSKIYSYSKRNKTIDVFSLKNNKDKKNHYFIGEEKKSDALDEGLRNYKMNIRALRKIVINCEMGNKKENL